MAGNQPGGAVSLCFEDGALWALDAVGARTGELARLDVATLPRLVASLREVQAGIEAFQGLNGGPSPARAR